MPSVKLMYNLAHCFALLNQLTGLNLSVTLNVNMFNIFLTDNHISNVMKKKSFQEGTRNVNLAAHKNWVLTLFFLCIII